jgi:hypothetical protein
VSRFRSEPKRSSGLVPGFTAMAVLGMTAWYVLHQSVEVAPGRVELARLSTRRAQTAVSLNGVAGGATAGCDALAAASERNAPPPDRLAVRVSSTTAYCLGPIPDVAVARDDPARPPPAIRISGVTSSQPSDRDEATADALRQAREKLAEVFAALRSPIREVPTVEELWEGYVEKPVVEKTPTEAEKSAWREAKLDADRVWKVLTVSVSEEQLRQLRARQRLYDLSRWALAALVVLAISYAVLRAEERSQGYFTWMWLGVGAALVGGVVTLAIVL